MGSQVEATSFAGFGEMLRYLRRRARLTQRQLGLRVAYTEAHVCRLERDQRLPDPATLAEMFVPALRLENEPETAARLIELAREARQRRTRMRPAASGRSGLEALPEPPGFVVQRERLLAELRDRLKSERGLVLFGVAGAGKTTLAATLAREWAARGPALWFGFAEGVPMTVDTVLHRLAALLDCLGDRTLAEAIDTGRVPLDRQLRLATEALAARPVLLCLDNVHLVRDALGIATLVQQIAELGPGRLLLTSREDLSWPPATTVRIEGLSADEGERLAMHLAPELGPALCRRLVERTAGNPMLLRLAAGHLCGHRRDHGRLLEGLATQPEVAGYLLSTTVGRLSPDGQWLASLLAVLGQAVDLHDERLAELAQADGGELDWLAAIQELERSLLIDHPAQADLHPLVRDYLTARLVGDLGRRQRLHRAAAAWLEERAQDILGAARLWLRAGDARAAADLLCGHVDWLIGRGEAGRAAGLAAEVEARALRRTGAADLVRRLRVARGDLLVNTTLAAEAEESYRRALALAAPGPAAAQAQWKLAACLLQRDGTDEALELCRAAAAELPPEHALIRAQVAAVQSRAHQFRSEHELAIAAAREALGLAEPLRNLSPDLTAAVEAQAHTSLGTVLRQRREHGPAREHLERAVRAAVTSRLGQVRDRARLSLAALAFDEGDLRTSVELLTQLLREAEWCDDGYVAGRALLGIANVRALQDQPDVAVELLERSRRLKEQIGDRQGAANSRSQEVPPLLRLGRVEEARELASDAVRETAATGDRWILANHLRHLGIVEAVTGDLPAAQRALSESLSLAAAIGDRRQEAVVRIDLALVHLAAGRMEAALDVAGSPPVSGAGEKAHLTGLFFRGAVALLQGTTEDAVRAAEAMAARARRSGYYRYEPSARGLLAAVGTCIAPLDLVRLLWAPPWRPAGVRQDPPRQRSGVGAAGDTPQSISAT